MHAPIATVLNHTRGVRGSAVSVRPDPPDNRNAKLPGGVAVRNVCSRFMVSIPASAELANKDVSRLISASVSLRGRVVQQALEVMGWLRFSSAVALRYRGSRTSCSS
jgi:hypothetical protein